MTLLYSLIVWGLLLWQTHGHYQRESLVIGLFCFLICVFAWFRNPRSLVLDLRVPWQRMAPLAGASVFLVFLAFSPVLLYAHHGPALHALIQCTFVAACLALVAAGVVFYWRNVPQGTIFVPAIAAACVCLAIARFLIPIVSPDPHIDVYFVNVWAAADLLSGVNPYTKIYPDIYSGLYSWQLTYNYLPTTLLAATVTRLLGLDFRNLLILADIVPAIVAWRLAMKASRDSVFAWSLALLWLAMPASLFVIEQAWVDNLLLALAALAILCFAEKRIILCAVCVGLAAAAKQYGFVPGMVLAVAVFSRYGASAFFGFATIAGLTFASLMLPFILWSPVGFYDHTVRLLIEIPMRFDSLSVPAFFSHVFSITLPGWLLLVTYLLGLFVALGVGWRHARSTFAILLAISFCYAVLFLMGKQAYCNYYEMLAGFVVLAVASGASEKPV